MYIEPLEILASALRKRLIAGKPVNRLLLAFMDEVMPNWRVEPLVSMQTRLARAAARDASAAWNRHAGTCAACSRVGKDRGAAPCSSGAELRNEASRLGADARREADLDKQPIPGSETLW